MSDPILGYCSCCNQYTAIIGVATDAGAVTGAGAAAGAVGAAAGADAPVLGTPLS